MAQNGSSCLVFILGWRKEERAERVFSGINLIPLNRLPGALWKLSCLIGHNFVIKSSLKGAWEIQYLILGGNVPS